jgi:hypothetical protein
MRKATRREFMRTGAGAAGIGLLAAGEKAAADATVMKAAGRPDRKAIEEEIARRTAWELSRSRLTTDYYRIRRKLAYPLPLKELIIPEIIAPTIPNYPWSVWVLWELEERVLTLGWHAEWNGDKTAAAACARDLDALAGWPAYRQLDHPDLGSAHAAYTLWTAHENWAWLSEGLRKKIRAAAQRHAEDLIPRVEAYYGDLDTKEKLLTLPEPHKKLHNIPFIGTVGTALTAAIADHPGKARLDQRLHALFGAVLGERDKGYTEGAGYDGYVLAFVMDWLKTLPEEERKPVLDHPNLRHYLEESYLLAAPGSAQALAELSDVEPKEMPWHLTAQAKLQHFRPDPARAWHLGRCTTDWLRADALAAIHDLEKQPAPETPKAGARNACYAIVLRSGYDAEDHAVAMSCTNSPMGHLQQDNGSILIGTRGKWFITDPGYQQYMRDDEREFTLGKAAHNFPVVNGHAQTRKAPAPKTLEETDGGWHAVIDLTACYPEEAGVSEAVRRARLEKGGRAVISDTVAGASVERIEYHWHGHPDAAWWVEDNRALICLPEGELWFMSPQAAFAYADVHRLPGSRGQLTLIAQADPAADGIQWIFQFGSKP